MCGSTGSASGASAGTAGGLVRMQAGSRAQESNQEGRQMSTMAVAHEDERNGDREASGVMLALAEGLTGEGLEVCGPW
jgi:hypothetical protein